MKIKFNYLLIVTFAIAAFWAVGEQTAKAASKTKIILIGDSTVTDNAGWGFGFKQFLTDDAECINLSRGGRSSMSFMKEGRWTNALELHGDYYLIQFGHNNEPGKPGRSTDMATFVANMKQYVDDTRAIGAKPILVTPLTRRQWDKEHPGKIKSSLAPYAEEVRKIGTEKHVPVVDLQARSIELCESLGPEKCLEFSPPKMEQGTNTGKFDGTHLNEKGHVMFARLVVEELRRVAPELAPLLRSEPVSLKAAKNEAQFDAVVSGDGSGDYKTVQEAIAVAPDNSTKPFVVLIKPGKYLGQIIVPEAKRNIHFVGEELEDTVLTYDLNVYETNSATDLRFKGTGVVILADDFRAENLTIENTSGDHGQALALRVDGDRASFNGCRMLGWQDTLMINSGRDYFTNCFIAGRVDFIFGSATALFENCEIRSRNGGHITAASTPEKIPFGFIFRNCRLTGDPTPWPNPAGSNSKAGNRLPMADLGRPWRPYASVTYINCEMGDHIKPAGWDNWRRVDNEATARYAEYHSSGPGGRAESRVKWAKQLTDAEAERFTIENILGGADHWQPLK